MIKIECNTWDELMELIKKMIGTAEGRSAASKQHAAEAPAVEAPPWAAPDPVPDPAPSPAPVTASKQQVTRQEVQTKAISLMDAKKQDQLQALLKKYNVPALPSIPDDQLAAFMADMEAL